MCGKLLAHPEAVQNVTETPARAELQNSARNPNPTRVVEPITTPNVDVPSDSELVARSSVDPEIYPMREEYRPPSPNTLLSGPSILGLAAPEPTPEYSYLLEDEPNRSPGRVLVGLVLLAAVVAVGWWQVKQHGGPAVVAAAFKDKLQGKPPQDGINRSKAALQESAANPNARESDFEVQNGALTPAPTQPTAPEKAASNGNGQPSSNNSAESQGQPNAEQAVRKPENKEAASGSESQPGVTNNEEAVRKPAAEDTKEAEQSPASGSEQARRARPAQTELASKRSVENDASSRQTVDNGTTRLAEKYLYGQGVPQDCNRAVELLRPAAEASDVKARTMLGTMYATGHCVARDLPTSYRWFALALRQEPKNPWVSKDLEMVWNQMNPSDKQLAMKMAK
jgi:hypothetical protein